MYPAEPVKYYHVRHRFMFSNMTTDGRLAELPAELRYIQYDSSLEGQYLPAIRALISKDLSEPYSIYVYRYFLYQWGDLCFMAIHPESLALIGVIINKLESHQSHAPPTLRGYIAMLAVSSAYRNHGIATTLVRRAVDVMIERDADEVVLETEVTNTAAMKLYERLGFLRSKKLHRYYLNGNTAYRLVLQLKSGLARLPFDEAAGEKNDREETAVATPSGGRPLLDDPPSA